MNAYELELYKIAKARGDSITRQLADIVSQQADRIAELEKDLHMVQRHYDQLDTQLYPKELSDEKIEKIIKKHWYREYGNRNMMTFAKAIIKALRGEE
jgi:uncharacterized protein YwgA